MSTYYINTKADARSALARGLTDNTRETLPTYFLGDVVPIKLYFTDGAGAYVDWSGESNLEVRVAVGNLIDGTLYAIAENFTYSDNCYSDSFVFSTEALATAMSGLDSLTLTFEVEVTRSNGDSITVYQNSVEVRNQLISPLMGTFYTGGTYTDTDYHLATSQPVTSFNANKIKFVYTGNADVADFTTDDKVRYTEVGTGSETRYFNISAVTAVSANIIEVTVEDNLSEVYSSNTDFEDKAGWALIEKRDTASSGSGGSGGVTLPDYIWVTDSSSNEYLLYKDTDTLYSEYDAMYRVDQSTSNTTDGSLGWQYAYEGGSTIDYYLDGISTQSIEGTMDGGTTIEEYETTPASVSVDTSAWGSGYPTNLDGDYTYDSTNNKYTQDNGNGGEIIRDPNNSSYQWTIVDTNNSGYPWDRYNRTEAQYQFVETQPQSSESAMQNGATVTKN